MKGDRALSAIAGLSGLYDLVVGALLLFATDQLTVWFGVPAPQPPIHANLNGVFLIAVGAGYVMPYRDPRRHRGYLWLMGPVLKGAGAAVFVLDHLLRGSPSSFLLFALSDAALALITLWALLAFKPDAGRSG